MVAPININLFQKKSGWSGRRWGKEEEGKERMRRGNKWEEERNTGE